MKITTQVSTVAVAMVLMSTCINASLNQRLNEEKIESLRKRLTHRTNSEAKSDHQPDIDRIKEEIVRARNVDDLISIAMKADIEARKNMIYHGKKYLYPYSELPYIRFRLNHKKRYLEKLKEKESSDVNYIGEDSDYDIDCLLYNIYKEEQNKLLETQFIFPIYSHIEIDEMHSERPLISNKTQNSETSLLLDLLCDSETFEKKDFNNQIIEILDVNKKAEETLANYRKYKKKHPLSKSL